MSEKIQNAVVAQEKKAPSMVDYVKKFEPEIKKALPAAITPERFTRMVLTAISVSSNWRSAHRSLSSVQ